MSRPRAREAGVRFGDVPVGPSNAITDVDGVKVGHCTLKKGDGKLVQGVGPVRTGVTVILPHGDDLYRRPVKGTHFALNGCGGLVGALQVEEFGVIDSCVGLTNTMGMASVAEGLVKYTLERNPMAGIEHDTVIPVVSECDDSYLNDARGLHVRPDHVLEAIAAATDEVPEGAVGAGTGMVCYDFKGGIGTSSRVVDVQGEKYTIGIIVLSNHGERKELMIDGVPVGKLLTSVQDPHREENGSIVTVIATDAPLDARRLRRLAKRAGMGLALTGSCARNGSGDIMIAFSTANVHDRHQKERPVLTDNLLVDNEMSALFRATVDCTAEAIINSLFKGETVTGRDDNIVPELPIDETLKLLRAHGRL